MSQSNVAADPSSTLQLSVVVPTYKRPERVAALLERLAAQTLSPERFEVIFVDDGSPEPIAIEASRYRFAARVIRQANAGPASARNAGVEIARAPLVIFLNDDAVPHADLLALHLHAHASTDAKVAVLGAFPFTDNALREPFTRLLAGTDLLFDFPRLEHGKLHNWTFFWTCNLSLPKSVLERVGGFDGDTFREAIVEDVELGYRLEQLGLRVLYRADAICEHEHALTAERYFERAVRLGVNLARMWKKHGDGRILWQSSGWKPGHDYFLQLQLRCEAYFDTARKFVETSKRWSEGARERELSSAETAQIAKLTRQLSGVHFARGVLLELTGVDPGRTLTDGPRRGRLTSVVACSYNALAKTQNCVESLRRTHDPDFPTELIFVDNGSTDGSAEWLAAQPDLRLIRNEENRGAPHARNQALAQTRGEYVVFLDNDIVLTQGWLERLLYHAELDAHTASVGACADRASHGQSIEYDGPTDVNSIERFARTHASMNHRQAKIVGTLASFCLLVKRATIDAIGGFDERFSPWGFEDDDFTLRALLAGFHNRIALDVFVRHDTYSGPKLERHVELLQRHWKSFASKWGLGDVAYGDFSGLANLSLKSFDRQSLYVPFAGEPDAALPARRAATESTAGVR